MLETLIAQVASRVDLDAEQAEAAFTDVMEGRASPVQIAALLVGLRVKGEVASEIAGGVRALRRAMVPVEVPSDLQDTLVDTCGTGGGIGTFNISTAGALVAAGAGVRIAKHGNRSFTSRCGSADVLEALGVAIELTPEQMATVLQDAGIVFMFAPLLHPAMRHAGPVRRELGVRTIMNLLGPLTNPAGARRQLVGVPDPALAAVMAEALRAIGHRHALVVHGEPGMDELSPLGSTLVYELRDGAVTRSDLHPERELGWIYDDAQELSGGEPEENARLIEEILSGNRGGAARAAVVLNAGAAIYLGGRAESLADGVAEAERSLDARLGMETLLALKEASRAAAESGTG